MSKRYPPGRAMVLDHRDEYRSSGAVGQGSAAAGEGIEHTSTTVCRAVECCLCPARPTFIATTCC
jgi:hypothetical protein